MHCRVEVMSNHTSMEATVRGTEMSKKENADSAICCLIFVPFFFSFCQVFIVFFHQVTILQDTYRLQNGAEEQSAKEKKKTG